MGCAFAIGVVVLALRRVRCGRRDLRFDVTAVTA
jgi:hypothetical protein